MSFSRLRASSRYGKLETQRRWQAWCSLRLHPAKYHYDSAARCHPGPSTAAGSERQKRRTRMPKQRFAGRSAAENLAKRAHSTHYRIDASPKIRWVVYLAATGSIVNAPQSAIVTVASARRLITATRLGVAWGDDHQSYLNISLNNTPIIIIYNKQQKKKKRKINNNNNNKIIINTPHNNITKKIIIIHNHTVSPFRFFFFFFLYDDVL